MSGALADGLIAVAKARGAATPGIAALLRLRYLAQAIGEASGPIQQRHGVDGGGLDVLVALHITPTPHQLRPTTLYRMLGISSGGLTGRLDRLERMELIRRTADGADRRGSWITLTAKGEALSDRALDEVLALQARVAEALTEREQWVLDTLLRKLDAGLGSALAVARAEP